MKKTFLSLVVMAILLQGCQKEDFCNCLESTGSRTSETRFPGSFNTIILNNNIDVILVPDSLEFVEIICGKNLMDGISTKVSSYTLEVGNNNKCNWLRDFQNEFIVKVHFKSISQITYNGSGNLTCSDTLRENFLKVESWNGTGHLNFLINGGEVQLKLHTGPADISASGKAGVLYLYTAGNGFIRAADLESDYVNVATRSTGDCEVFAKTELGVNIDYNGDVFYKGNPPLINKSVTGTGKLIPF